MSNNILIIIAILLAICAIVYFYFNSVNDSCRPDNQSKMHMDEYQSLKWNSKYRPKFRPKSNSKKRVSFNKGIKLFTYSKPSSVSSTTSSISILSDSDYSDTSATSNKSTNSIENNEILPSNLDTSNDDETWDAGFGIPLATEVKKKLHADELVNDHKKYSKSFGKFNQYLTDNSAIIKTDITIDPFKPEEKSKTLDKTIREIYDEQVAGPKAIPKKIKTITKNSIIYEEDSEMTGGNVMGTNLVGFDGNSNYQSADFGNGF